MTVHFGYEIIITMKCGLKSFDVKPRLAKQILIYLAVSKRKNLKQGYLIPCDVTPFCFQYMDSKYEQSSKPPVISVTTVHTEC